MRHRKALAVGNVLLTIILVVSTSIAAYGGTYPEQQAAAGIQKAVAYLRGVQNQDGGFPFSPGRGSSRAVTAWVVMALAAAGEDVTGSSWAPAGKTPVDYLENAGEDLKSTSDFARELLALTAAGLGKEERARDLARKLASFQQGNGQIAQPELGEQGFVNCHMWAVLAIVSAGADIPDKAKAKEWLAVQQKKDGGFGWAKDVESDPDDTAVAVQALVALGENPEKSQAIKRALEYLKTCQAENGGFCWEGNKPNSATDSWVLQSLIAAGEDPAGDAWQKNGKHVVDHLLSLQAKDGSFNWMEGSGSSPVLMTAYAVTALSKKPFPLNPAKKALFSDLTSEHYAYEAVMQLVDAGVLGGYPDGSFKPDRPVTRAEFTKFLVRCLGQQDLYIAGSPGFDDVPENHWAREFISTAAGLGYIKGRSARIFDPEGKITGAELAAMIVRALPAGKLSGGATGPHLYSESVNTAEKHRLLYPGFDAGAVATRAQCAYSIARLRDLLMK